MFRRCAPNMASRQRSANGSSVARRPIAADARFMSNGSCPSNARTNARTNARRSAKTSVSRRTRAMDAASKPGAGTAMAEANAPRGAPAGQSQAPSQQDNARQRARFKKPGRNAGKSLPGDKKPRLPVLPMSMAIGRNVWRGQTGNSRRKMGARVETRNVRYRAATKRKRVPMVRARQDPTQSRGAADRQAPQNHPAGAGAGQEGATDPQKGALEHDPKKLQTFWIRSCDKTKR